jgi:hypothetical protein
MSWFTFAGNVELGGTGRPVRPLSAQTGEQEMAEVDRVTPRVAVEVGHMPLRVYIERFAGTARHEHVCSPATASDMCEASEPVLQAYAFTLMDQR